MRLNIPTQTIAYMTILVKCVSDFLILKPAGILVSVSIPNYV